MFTVQYALGPQIKCIRFRPYMGKISRTIYLSDTHAASWNFPLLFLHLNTNWNTNKSICYNILTEHFVVPRV